MKRRRKKVTNKTVAMWNRVLKKFASDMNRSGVLKVTVKPLKV